MLVLGIQSSPRKKGNTAALLNVFMEEAKQLGAVTRTVYVDSLKVEPCHEYLICETKGLCPIKDYMHQEMYSLLWQADVIVVATPIFFYNVPAQLKAVIDRCQTLWTRKYRLHIEDPKRKWRKGFLMAIGATKGKTLFDGTKSTMKYFFDAVGASFVGSLTYHKIESIGDIEKHPTAFEDAKLEAQKLIQPLINRKRIMFACRQNSCRSQMSAAFAEYYAGDRLDVISGGSEPADIINPLVKEVMKEKGIDMEFRTPKSIIDAISNIKPQIIVGMGCGETGCPYSPGGKQIDWDLPDPAGKSIEFMREVRDEIEKRILALIKKIDSEEAKP